MTPQQWRRVKDLFLEAIQQPAEQRLAFIRQRCGDDSEALAELESMLAAHEQISASDESQATREPPDPTNGSSDRIGRYKLLQQIGEGGMGIVYMAQQEHPVRRKVALKIIKPGMDSAQVIARFEAERQALAMMDHPNIARVLEAGTTDAGRPYFVMELVQGIPITKYCDSKHLTPRQRLELFVPVCQAVQHAHQKGIIHRDLKPSNVLVMTCDGKPVPKVIDFGVAKALHQRLTEKTLFTQFGNVVGTLEYMSPEQTDLDVTGTDTRSDIYSLGVMLYELLTGSTPLDGKKLREIGYEQMLKTIREQEPPRPSTRLSHSGDALASVSASRNTDPKKLVKLIAGDLDWIVMKCLEKDRARRYESADGLARDIQRHLSDEPVEASPPSATYRLRKLLYKYRVPLRVAAMFVFLLVIATVLNTWQTIRAKKAQAAAVAGEKRATTAEGIALNEKKQTQLQLANTLLVQGDASLLADRPDEAYQSYTKARTVLTQLEAPIDRVKLAFWNLYQRYPPPLNRLAIDEEFLGPRAPMLGGRATLCTAARPGKLILLDMADGHEIRSLDAKWPWAASRDGRRVLSAAKDGSITLWDITQEGPVRRIAAHRGEISTVALSADGTLGLSGGHEDDLIKLWNVETGAELSSVKIDPQHGAFRAILSPDGRFAAVEDGRWKLFDVAGWREVYRGNQTVSGLPEYPMFNPPAVFSSDSHLALIYESARLEPAGVTSVDLRTGRALQTLRPSAGSYDSLFLIAFCPDDRTAILVSGKQVYLWDCVDGHLLPELHGTAMPPLSADGRLQRTALKQGHNVSNNDIFTLTPLREVPQPEGDAPRLSAAGGADSPGEFNPMPFTWSGNNFMVAVPAARDSTVLLLGSDHDEITIAAHGSWACALSNAGDLIVTADEQDHSAILCDTCTGRGLRRYPLSEQLSISTVAFSPECKSIYIGCRKSGSKNRGAEKNLGVLFEFDLLTAEKKGQWDIPTLEHGGFLSHEGRGFTWGEGGVDGRGIRANVRDLRTNRDRSYFLPTRGPDSEPIDVGIGEPVTAEGLASLEEFGLLGPKPIALAGDKLAMADNDYSQGSNRCKIYLYELRSKQLLNTLNNSNENVFSIALAFSGRFLLSDCDSGFWIWDTAAGHKLYSYFVPDTQRIIVSADGQVAACVSRPTGEPDYEIHIHQFDRGFRYCDFAPRLEEARRAIRQNPNDAAALATFGQWYAFRRKWDWAIEFLERARAQGVDVSPLILGQAYFALERKNSAYQEFQKALLRKEGSETYLRLCLTATGS